MTTRSIVSRSSQALLVAGLAACSFSVPDPYGVGGAGSTSTVTSSSSNATAATSAEATSSSASQGGCSPDLQTDPANCGACGNTCTAPGFPVARCDGGHCGAAALDPALGLGSVAAAASDRTSDVLYVVLNRAPLAVTRLGGPNPAVVPLAGTTSTDRVAVGGSGGKSFLGYQTKVMASDLLFSIDWNVNPPAVGTSPLSSTAFPFVTVASGEATWSADRCVRRAFATSTSLACYQGMNNGPPAATPTSIAFPDDPSRAFVFIVADGAPGGRFARIGVTSVMPSEPLSTPGPNDPVVAESPERSVDVSGDGATLFHFAKPGGALSFGAFSTSAGTTTILGPSGVGEPVAVIRTTDLIVWLVRNDDELRVYTSSPGDTTSAPALRTAFVVPGDGLVRSATYHVGALYFVRDGTLFRVAG